MNGKPMYTTKSNQFVNLVKGEYGKTPVEIDPEFRLKIADVREETPYDTSKYQMQPNPVLEDCGGVKLAATEKEVLLLELFPLVAKPFLTNLKKEAFAAQKAASAPEAKVEEKKEEATPKVQPITGKAINAPLPGRVIELKVKVGDAVKAGQEVVVLEAMKMENSVTTDVAGYVRQIFVAEGDNVASDAVLIEVSAEAPVVAKAEAAGPKPVVGKTINAPLPGRVITIKVQAGDDVKVGQEVAVLEAMKMENSINADFAGKVRQVLVAEGDNVATDAALIELE
jgi:biotin carboxyl carrier protein